MAKPVIAIAWAQPDYVASVERADAEPRLLESTSDDLPSALDECDGVLLTGGVDVDPARYHAQRHPTVEIDRTRDEFEFALATMALERNLPILAICRGVQLLNVVAGGTLIQDIPSQRPSELPHSIPRPADSLAHDVEIRSGTALSALLADRIQNGGRMTVNSRHHQAVDIVAPGFVVSATAPDGLVEAIEKPGTSFCVGVQWHPENFWRHGDFSGLFDGFIAAARAARERRGRT